MVERFDSVEHTALVYLLDKHPIQQLAAYVDQRCCPQHPLSRLGAAVERVEAVDDAPFRSESCALLITPSIAVCFLVRTYQTFFVVRREVLEIDVLV